MNTRTVCIGSITVVLALLGASCTPDEAPKPPLEDPPAPTFIDAKVVAGKTVTLSAPAEYSEFDKVTYLWTQKGGVPVTLDDPTSAKPSFETPMERAKLTFMVTIDDGETKLDHKVWVNVLVDNNKPEIVVGGPYKLQGGESVLLDASATTDPDDHPLTWAWEQVSGAPLTLSNPHFAMPSVLADGKRGYYGFKLTVSDGIDEVESDQVVVYIENNKPVVYAGAEQTVAPGDEVELAPDSYDLDGDPVTVSWTQISGPDVIIHAKNTAGEADFKAPSTKGDITLRVTASDGHVIGDPSFITITVANTPPTVDAGKAQSVDGGAVVSLTAEKSADVDGDTLTYEWTQLSGPDVQLTGADTVSPTFIAPMMQSVLAFRVVVGDGEAQSEGAEVIVSVKNNIPVAHAGADQAAKLGSIVTLDGSKSFDLEGLVGYHWIQIYGPTVSLFDGDTAAPTFVAPNFTASLGFELTVCDQDDLCSPSPDHVLVLVGNAAPIADAGDDQLVTGGKTVVLDASESSDVDGDALTYTWTQVDGTPVLMKYSETASPSFMAPVAAQKFKFQVVVHDGYITSEPDTMIVEVANHAPVADAGPNQLVTGGSVATLDGTFSSDLDNDLLTFHWAQADGPIVALDDTAAAKPTFTAPLSKAVLRFELTVSDGQAVSKLDIVAVTVANNAPVADAGADQSVDVDTKVTLNGSESSDADGDALTYTWTQIDGTPVILSAYDVVAPKFVTGALKSSIVFELVVDDGEASSAADIVVITVNNTQPVAHAGVAQQVQPGEPVALDGTGSEDGDGDPITYHWTQIDGEPIKDLNNSAPTLAFLAPAKAQTLTFELRVHDGYVWSEPATVDVIVGNAAPVVDAGPNQTVVGGTVVTLAGTGTDPNGEPVTFQWTQLEGAPVALTDNNAPTTTFTAPIQKQLLRFELTVTDEDGAETADSVEVLVPNHVPIAVTSADLTISGGDLVTLDGTASSDLDGDSLSYQWTQLAGEKVFLGNDSTAKVTFTAPSVKGTLRFELIVSDGEVVSQPAEVIYTVKNNAPVAVGSAVQCAAPKALVELNGSDSFDADGDDLTFYWTQIGGPMVITYDKGQPTPKFTAPDNLNTTVKFLLVVGDGDTMSAPTVVSVYITDQPC